MSKNEGTEENESPSSADKMMEAMEGFGNVSAMLGGFRRQLMDQGFAGETADHLVAMSMGESLQENNHKREMKLLEAQRAGGDTDPARSALHGILFGGPRQ